MAAALLDGKKLAQTMQAELAAAVADFTRRTYVRPGLAAVLVGDRPDSRSYVTSKRKACEKVGIDSQLYEMPAAVTQSELLGLVQSLNEDRNTSFVPWLIGTVVVLGATSVAVILIASKADEKPVDGTLAPFTHGTQGFRF